MSEDAELAGFKLKPDWFREHRGAVFPTVLNLDLAVTSEPSGLAQFVREKKHIIDAPVVFQVNEVTDASLPRSEREELKMSSSGTLRLLLSDGASEFIGIAKGQFTFLNPASRPGVKIKTISAVEMRYGVLFLSDAVVRVLGGFSPELEEKRAQAFNPRRGARTATTAPPPAPLPQPAPQPVQQATPVQSGSQRSTQFLMSSDEFSLSDTESDDGVWAEKPKVQAKPSVFLDDDDDDDESDIIEIEASEMQSQERYESVRSLKERKLSVGAKWEVVRTRAKVVDCFDFTFNKRGEKFLVHLLCKIVDETGFMVIRVAPLLLEQVLGVAPSVLVKKSDEEKGVVFRQLKEHFMSLPPPLVLLQREKFRREEEKFVLTSEELAQEIATASYE